MKFAQKLQSLMDDRNLSFRDVAVRAGTSSTTVARWLDQALARLLGVPLDYLAVDAQDKPAPGLSEEERTILDVVRSIGDTGEVLRRLFAGVASGGR
jgi:hypothetical protein